MAAHEARFIDPAEAREWIRAEQRSFGLEPDDRRLDQLAPVVEVDRSCAAFDGDQIVATGAAFTTTMRLPGGAAVPVGAVTGIGTRPTHTRQGLFRRIMSMLHEQSAQRGEPATVLLASESQLYPRFGYGLATAAAWAQLDRRRVRFRPEVSISDRLEMYVDVVGAGDLVANVWQAVDRPGWVDRPVSLRDVVLADHEGDRDGAMPFTLVVHRDETDRPDGYCLYRRKAGWHQGQSNGSLFIHELVTTSDQARLTLWRHCLDIDLVESVEAMPVPIDEPLPDALIDRRQFRTIGVHDQVWLRAHDVAHLLSHRRYVVPDAVVIDVTDVGRFRVEGGPDSAEVTVSTANPDAVMGRAEIGSLIVGNSLLPYAATGRIQLEYRLRHRLDRFFRWPVAPYNQLEF